MNNALIKLLDQISLEAVLGYAESFENFTDLQVNELINKFETILNLDPDNKYLQSDEDRPIDGYTYTLEALAFLPDLYIIKKEYEKARKAVLKTIRFTKSIGDDEIYHVFQSENYCDLGIVHYLLGQIDEALHYFNKSIEFSNNYKAFLGICLCHKKKRDLKEARANLNMARMIKALDSARHKII